MTRVRCALKKKKKKLLVNGNFGRYSIHVYGASPILNLRDVFSALFYFYTLENLMGKYSE